MHSPLASPSLRSLAAHHSPHLPRTCTPTSYFPPPGSPTISARYFTSPRTNSPQLNPNSSPNLVGCLNIRQQQQQQHQQQAYPSPKPLSHSRPSANRRDSLRESAIPLKPTPPANAYPHLQEPGRRRPSFKIDLPPRPIPAELLDQGKTTGSTPYPITESARTQAYASPAVTYVKGTPHPLDIDPFSHDDQPQGGIRPPFLRDPFGNNGEFVILTADPASPTYHPGEHQSEVEPEYTSGVGLVGLGYSLNRMRAPTPWIRGKADEGEWLSERDMDDLQG